MSLQLEKESLENSPGGGRALWPLIALVALIVAGLIGFAYWRRNARAPETAAPAAAASTGTVKVLMEQQWRVKMMLAQAESQSVAQRINATGRVIPAALHQAIVAPPVGGLIAGNGLPRIGQRVARGQTIAMLRQALSAAEL